MVQSIRLDGYCSLSSGNLANMVIYEEEEDEQGEREGQNAGAFAQKLEVDQEDVCFKKDVNVIEENKQEEENEE